MPICPLPFPAVWHRRLTTSCRSGFTLTELLIVLVLIAILAALLFPAFSKARARARSTVCQSQLKQIGLGLMQYTQDYDEVMPPRYSGTVTADTDGGRDAPPGWSAPPSDIDARPLNWRVLLQPYLQSGTLFACPANPKNDTSATALPSPLVPPGTPEVPISYACNYNSGNGLGAFGDESGRDKVAMSAFEYPSQTIAVAETTSPRPDLNLDDIRLFGQLFAGHNGASNYLFADGHVKSLRPLQTYFQGDTVVNLWQRDLSEFPR